MGHRDPITSDGQVMVERGLGWKDVPSADARFFFQFLANSMHDSVFFFKVRWLDTQIQVPLMRGLKGA